MTEQYILALDQGTTSSRAMVFNRHGQSIGSAQQEYPQILPAPGEVEHDPEAIWSSQLATAREAVQKAGITADQIAALGIANQRETTVLWDRQTGRPIDHAIVWQSRVTAGLCDELRRDGLQADVQRKTGLVIDPYFSGTKIQHLLKKHPDAFPAAAAGQVLFGTVDSWLIWKLTGQKRHVTDPSNASRTMLYNIHTLSWDEELLSVLRIPRAMLPEVVPTSGVLGETDPHWFGRAIPIAAAAGDQQAATFGQVCFRPGMAKNTYGTGCFLLLNTGQQPVASRNKLLTTVGWQIGHSVTYCLEGAVFVAGAAVQWLRDGLGLIKSSQEVESLAQTVSDNGGLYLVPAFVGLGAPYWDAYATGTMVGLTRGTNAGHLARATLESIGFQTRDLIEAMQRDCGVPLEVLKVDGGASVNDTLMQFQADILGAPVQRPTTNETTALGAAYLAGLAVGYWSDVDELEKNWTLQKQFDPEVPAQRRELFYKQWQRAVNRSLKWNESGA